MSKALKLLILFLGIYSSAFAADTLLCTDDDDNGAISVFKSVGKFDRDCDHEGSKSDGGPDCDDNKWDVFKGSYNTYGCAGGSYRTCDPAGSGDYTACVATDIHTTGYNTYYVSGAGSGTACTSGSPCAVNAVSSGGSVTTVNPVEIVWIGATDLTTTGGFSTQRAGNSTTVPNKLIRDPRATGKWNMAGSSLGSAMIFGHDNWSEYGFEITGGSSLLGQNPAIVVNSSHVEIYGNWIHDYQCDNNNNCGGVYVAIDLSDRRVHNNLIVNIQDATKTARFPTGGSPDPGTRQNVFAIRGFRNHGDIYEKNLISWNHAPDSLPYQVQGQGISVKHGWAIVDATTATEIRWNVISNSELQAVADNSSAVHTHGNLFLQTGGQGVEIGPGGDGGSSAWYDIQANHNTNVSHYRAASGAIQAGAATTETVVAGATLDGNVWEDSAQLTYGGGNHIDMVDIANGGNNTDYTALFVTKKVFNFLNNCYHNSNFPTLTAAFDVFANVGAGGGGPGSVENFAGWKSVYAQDTTGAFNGDMALSANYEVTAVCPVGTIGWESEWQQAAPTPTPTPGPTAAPGVRNKGQYSYCTTKGQR